MRKEPVHERETMKIDKRIRRAAKSTPKLYTDLGFQPREAKRLHGAAIKQLDETTKLRKHLMVQLNNWMTEHEIKQAEAAEVLLVSRPRVSDLVNMKTANFTIDTLVRMMGRIGKSVSFAG